MTYDTVGGPISKSFGAEVVTTYSGSPLNRLSFLRENPAFLREALDSPDARVLCFKQFNALIDSKKMHLQWLPLTPDLAEIIGRPYDATIEERVHNWDPTRDASGVSHAQVVFLGIDENLRHGFSFGDYQGAPRFAVDVTIYEHTSAALKSRLEDFYNTIEGEFLSVMFGTALASPSDYAVIAQARIVLDWINRTRFCGGCGHRNMSAWGGFKLICPDSQAGRVTCPTKGRLTNLSFPRTDCCIIAAVLSHDGQRVLLGRSKRFPGKMYSTLAGFLEGGESLEDCVRREIWEEAGVRVGRVLLYASQPWPYPANLMVGCIGEIKNASAEAHKINLGNDPELADARWVSLPDLRRAVDGDAEDLDFAVPPRTSIAWVLLHAVSYGLRPNL